MKRLLLTCLATACLSSVGLAQRQPFTPAETAIAKKLGTLRKLPDDERAKVTKNLAGEISGLPVDNNKLLLAQELSNLSTEGDFGPGTLQAVTDTLVVAVTGVKGTAPADELQMAYDELAQLSLFEGMRVHLKEPSYTASIAKLKAQDRERQSADFTLTDITGKSWTRTDLKGKIVLVNFWATWCPPCRKEMPDLNELYAKFKDQGLVILAISDEKADTVKTFIAKQNYDYPVLLDQDRKVNTLYHVDGIPKSFVYNRKGKLVAESIDMRTRGQFMKMLAKAGLH